MPLVRMTTSVACEDLPNRPGDEVQLSPERAQQVVAAGWGEIVRGKEPEIPERRVTRPETAVERPEHATATTETPEAPAATEGDSPPAAATAPVRRRPARKPKA